jgi:hypothetical protein
MPADGGLAAARRLPLRSSACASTPTAYHLAHGLLDYAEYLSHLDDDEAAEAAIGEARDIAGRLRCQPLPHRAADLLPAEPRIRGSMVSAPIRQQSEAVRDG